MEIQINGGDAAAKVDFAKGLFEKEITVDSIFNKDENIDEAILTKRLMPRRDVKYKPFAHRIEF